jgi:hypothetical protein
MCAQRSRTASRGNPARAWLLSRPRDPLAPVMTGMKMICHLDRTLTLSETKGKGKRRDLQFEPSLPGEFIPTEVEGSAVLPQLFMMLCIGLDSFRAAV